MGVADLIDSCRDYRLPSLLPSARESRLFAHDRLTADAQSYANIIAFIRTNQMEGGGRNNHSSIDNNRNTINESSTNQNNNRTRNNDPRTTTTTNNNDNNNTRNNNNRSVDDSVPSFALEELSEADLDSDALIDGFFHSPSILPSSPFIFSHPSSILPINNDPRSSGPIRHQRTRAQAPFSFHSNNPIITSSHQLPFINEEYYYNTTTNNNNDINDTGNYSSTNSFIEEALLPIEFLEPPSSSPQPMIDFNQYPLEGLQLQELAAI